MQDPGARDRLVTVEQRPTTDEVDASGTPTATWTILTTWWAEIRSPRGNERFTAEQESAAVDVVFEGCYRADIDPELVDVPKLRRLSYQGRTYNIQHAEHVGRRDGVRLLTLARVG